MTTPTTDAGAVVPSGNLLAELSDAEDRDLIDRLTPSTAAEIETAIRVVQRINYGAAYGHDPKLCAATAETLGALRTANHGGLGTAARKAP